MNNRSVFPSRRGFTLMELMVAMTITILIVGVLMGITKSALDTWNRSRAELRASRQARAMIDALANDFESMVTRSSSTQEWLTALSQVPDSRSSNAAMLVFFTCATDRYEGQVGVAGEDDGGDICCVGYQLQWRDPIAPDAVDPNETFVLKRYLVDPKPTFAELLGKTDAANRLDALYLAKYSAELDKSKYFVCENIFQFTTLFHVDVINATGGVETKIVSISSQTSGKREFRIVGSDLVMDPADASLQNGVVTAVEVSLTVLTDAGINQLRENANLADDSKWLAKNSYHFARLIQVPHE
ncbi:MAG TPA: prepilin-type N-terminal cleavage/methylation domain-containing protein [Luteolibacter sp.]|nr:prepilin-type N-terminal cleavage/methylation domain-containing protein [Luteolibacter sp.]